MSTAAAHLPAALEPPKVTLPIVGAAVFALRATSAACAPWAETLMLHTTPQRTTRAIAAATSHGMAIIAILIGSRSSAHGLFSIVDASPTNRGPILPDRFPVTAAQVVGESLSRARSTVDVERLPSWLGGRGPIRFRYIPAVSEGAAFFASASWHVTVSTLVRPQTKVSPCSKLVSSSRGDEYGRPSVATFETREGSRSCSVVSKALR